MIQLGLAFDDSDDHTIEPTQEPIDPDLVWYEVDGEMDLRDDDKQSGIDWES